MRNDLDISKLADRAGIIVNRLPKKDREAYIFVFDPENIDPVRELLEQLQFKRIESDKEMWRKGSSKVYLSPCNKGIKFIILEDKFRKKPRPIK